MSVSTADADDKWSRITARANKLSQSLTSRQANSNGPRVENYKKLVKTLAEKKSVLELLKPSKSESLDGESVAMYKSFSPTGSNTPNKKLMGVDSSLLARSTSGTSLAALDTTAVQPSASTAAIPLEGPTTLETPSSLAFSPVNSPVPVSIADPVPEVPETDSMISSSTSSKSSSSSLASVSSNGSVEKGKPSVESKAIVNATASSNLVAEVKPVEAASVQINNPRPLSPSKSAPPSMAAPLIEPSKTLPSALSPTAPRNADSAVVASPVASPVPTLTQQDSGSKKMTVDDFESLAIIGRGAFGEVRLVRRKDSHDREVYGKF